jgi:hypothetical protein
MTYMQVCQLYSFGASRRIHKLCNAALDAFHGLLVAHAPRLPYDMINYVYEHTEKADLLRSFLIEVVVRAGDRYEIEDWQGKLPVQFFMDLLSAAALDRIVPFEAEPEAERYLVGLEGDLCGLFHEHRWDDEGEAEETKGDGDGDGMEEDEDMFGVKEDEPREDDDVMRE